MSTPASTPPFEESHRKVAAYLRLCGLAPGAADSLGSRLIENTAVVTAGKEKADEEPGRSAVADTLESIDVWAGDLVPAREGESPEHRGARGRAQMFAAGLPQRWPEAFLAPAQPAELQAALTATSLQLTPELSQTVMTPQSLHLGAVATVADETWRTFDKWPFLRGLCIWALFLLLLGGAFYLIRF